jgi:hypothetical protein
MALDMPTQLLSAAETHVFTIKRVAAPLAALLARLACAVDSCNACQLSVRLARLQGFHTRLRFRKNSLLAAKVIIDDMLKDSGGYATSGRDLVPRRRLVVLLRGWTNLAET